MADLLTHYVSARIPGGFLASPAARTTLVLGVFLPDLLGKALGSHDLLPDHIGAPSHSALGLFLICWTLAMFFEEAFRLKAFVTLYVGSMLHVAVDLLKDNLGSGSAYLLHPFSVEGVELGLYQNENILWILPANLVVLWGLKRLAKRAQRAGLVWR